MNPVITVYFGRNAPVEWIVIRFPARDFRIALWEVYYKHENGDLTDQEFDCLQRRIIEAVRDLRALA